MVKFTVHTLSEHVIVNMVVTSPYRDIIMTMAEMSLATYSSPPNGDLDYAFAEYIIGLNLPDMHCWTERRSALAG